MSDNAIWNAILKPRVENVMMSVCTRLLLLFPLVHIPLLGTTPEIHWIVKKPDVLLWEHTTDTSGNNLYVHEQYTVECYPLLPVVFFDSGSSSIPARYVLFANSVDAMSFHEDSLTSTLNAYYNILNVIGSRLSTHALSTLTLHGFACNEAQEPNTLARARATSIRDYLLSIWGIDPKQIHIEVSALNDGRQSTLSHDRMEENRRVEMESDTWDVVRPSSTRYSIRRPDPPAAEFQLLNGMPFTSIAKRTIRISYQGKLWKQIAIPDQSDTCFYNWRSEENKLPPGEGVMQAQLIVTDTNAHDLISNTDTIRVHRYFADELIEEHLSDYKMEVYQLLFFDYNSSDVTRDMENILRSYVFNRIQQNSRVILEGFANDLPNAEHNAALSIKRANAIKKRIHSEFDRRTPVEVRAGDNQDPLFPPNLPEGRYLNRTVRVMIRTPIQYKND